MGYKPTDEDGVGTRVIAAGGTVSIPNSVGGTATLKTVTVTNNEHYPLVAQITCDCRVRSELINAALRVELEGYFLVSMTTGAIYGSRRSYQQIHMPGSNGVASTSWGFSAAEAILMGGNLSAWTILQPGASDTFTVEWISSQTLQNLRTAGGLGYVQFFAGSLLLQQERGGGFDYGFSQS